MIKGAIFDADGTLLDSMLIWDILGRDYLARQGIEAEENLSEILFDMSFKGGACYVKERYELSEPVETIMQGMLEDLRDFYVNRVELKPGSYDFLKKFNREGTPMSICTSNNRDLIIAAFRRLGILKFFDHIFTCDEFNTDKNGGKIYLEAAKKMEVKPEDTWVFEDALFAVKSAGEAGFRTVCVRDIKSEKDRSELMKLSDIYVDDLTDFKGVRAEMKKQA